MQICASARHLDKDATKLVIWFQQRRVSLDFEGTEFNGTMKRTNFGLDL